MPTMTLAEIRLRACKLWPYGSQAILSLVPVESRQLQTMAVDQHWRLYYNPERFGDRTVDEWACIVLHEVSHLLLKHHQRAARLFGKSLSAAQLRQWNKATDYAINWSLRNEGLPLSADLLFPETAGFPGGLSADEYLRLLDQPAEPKSGDCDSGGDQSPSETDSADGSDGSDNSESSDSADDTSDTSESADKQSADQSSGTTNDESPSGGSCADGQQRPWELPPPDKCDTPGLKPHEADILVHETAQRVLDKQRGEAGGAWQCWAASILHPRVDPRIALLRLVRHAVECTSGQGDYSYRRPSRRNSRADMLLPSAVQPIPRVTVIVDTSGSMTPRDLGLSLGLIGKVLNSFRIRDGIQVVTGDVQAVAAARVFEPRQVTLAGGGGTNMGQLIGEVALHKPRPQLIVVCTDGITPWCDPISIPVVACLTRAERDAWPVPTWIKKVSLI